MRKIFLAACVSLSIGFTACNNTSSSSGTDADTQKNLDAAHMVDAAFRTGDVSKIDSVVSKDYVDHTDHGDVKGVDSMKAMISVIHTNFSDMKMDTKSEVANKDYVFSWMEFSGNNTKAGMGMPMGPYDMHVVEVSRFKDGKCVEHWEYVDPQEMMKMMGNEQQMDKKMDKKTDSTVKK